MAKHIVAAKINNITSNQFVGSVKRGAQLMVGAIKNFITSCRHKMNTGVFQLDFSNAFNTIDRNVFIHKIHESIPELFHFIKLRYSAHAHLVCSDGSVLSSQKGVLQGDALASLICELSISDYRVMTMTLISV